MTRPAIHSICVVKNEGDIITHCLHEALKWSAHVIVYDGASTDGTWEKVCDFAKRDPRVIPWKQDGKVFQESLRAEVFNAFRHLAKHGDWWCHLDSDEFFVEDPSAFLGKIRRPYDVVWGQSIEYYLTHEDVETLDFGAPLEQLLPRLKHYNIKHAEPRFFRHRDKLQWDVKCGWPAHMGLSHPELIHFKHFKYRTPQQIQLRLDTRRANVERGFPGWEHARSLSWKEQICSSGQLHVDDGKGNWIVDECPDHKGSLGSRIAKYALHGLGIWP